MIGTFKGQIIDEKEKTYMIEKMDEHENKLVITESFQIRLRFEKNSFKVRGRHMDDRKIELVLKTLGECVPRAPEKTVEKIEIDEKPTNSKKILVVDDNQINIKIATKMLEKYNYDIDTASSGQESIEKVKNTKYDLIFMDHMMPGMDGIETLKELKKIDGFNTPVIALTADAIVGSKEKFLEAGFDDYISKPIDRNYLDELIKKILG